MLLTTFELLVKKIAPPQLTAPFNRLVVQGYFLTVSNLDLTKDIAFNLRLTIPSDDLADPNEIAVDREFVRQNLNISPANHTVVYDINGLNNFSQLLGGTGLAPFKRYNTTKIILKKGQTVSVQILPNVSGQSFTTSNTFSGNPLDYNLTIRQKMEIRGFVEILQAFPAVAEPKEYNLPPIDVLISAEIRGTFFPNALPAEQDYDQINYSLPIADGKSRVTLAAAIKSLPNLSDTASVEAIKTNIIKS